MSARWLLALWLALVAPVGLTEDSPQVPFATAPSGSADLERIAAGISRVSKVKTIAFSPDGRTLASGSVEGTIRLWDVARATPAWSVRGHAGGARAG